VLNKLFSLFSSNNKKTDDETTPLPTVAKLQEKIISELLYDFNNQWNEITLHFEYFKWKDNYFKKYLSGYKFNNTEGQYTLNIEAIDAIVELNNEMSKNGNEKWTWFEFKLDSTGKYNFDFKYGMPPLTKEMLEGAGEI